MHHRMVTILGRWAGRAGERVMRPLCALAQLLKLEVPIISEVYKVIHESRSPHAAFRGLPQRGARSEAELE